MKNRRKRTDCMRRKVFAAAVICCMATGFVMGMMTDEVNAAEVSLAGKPWDSSMTKILKSRNGEGYEASGLCTGYVAWAIQHSGLYDVSSWPDNGYVADFESRLKSMGVTRVSRSEAAAGDIVVFGSQHISILGADGKLHHNTTSRGIVSGQETIEEWLSYGGTKTGEVRIYRGFSQEVEISVVKKSSNEGMTEGNDCYSLEGAVYGVYTKDDNKLVTKLTTDENGKASAEIMTGEYILKEISPSKGYALDKKEYEVDASEDVTKTVYEVPQSNPVDAVVYKIDGELRSSWSTDNKPQGGASLKNAEFTIKYYKGNYTDEQLKSISPERTWVVKTDDDGKAVLDEKHLVSGGAFYRNSAGRIVIPLGTVSIQETKAPEGYFISDVMNVRRITTEGSAESIAVYNAPAVKDQIKRGDLKLIKVKDTSLQRLAGVPFALTSKTTGERHILVCDVNGQLSTSESWNGHNVKTNVSDNAYDSSTGKVDETKLDSEAGVWFGSDGNGKTAAVKNGSGALPYDTYILDELACSANEGLKLLKGIEVSIYRDSVTVDMGTLTNDILEIHTSAADKELNSKVSFARDNVVIEDTVSYEGLTPGAVYTLKGRLMDRHEEEPLVIDDTDVTAQKTFTASGGSGSEKIRFVIDASELEGKEIVVFERLMQSDVTVAVHENFNDENQTVIFEKPLIRTSAKDAVNGTQMSFAGTNVTVKDTVKYEGLVPGQKYLLKGIVAETETGEALIAGNGENVTAEKSFTAENSEGSVEVEFTFDASCLQGRSVVVFEELIWNGSVIAEHADKNDKWQMIYFPEISTSAADSDTNRKYVAAEGEISITDTVAYQNLVPGKEYMLYGYLMDKHTGQTVVSEGNTVENTTVFTADERNGTAEVDFVFDASEMEGKSVVVFEELFCGNELIAEHKDINDSGQTVRIVYKKVAETFDKIPIYVVIATGLMVLSAAAALCFRGPKRTK